MIEVVWEFQAKQERVSEFERDYSGCGPWAKLFSLSPRYQGTRLLRDQKDPLRFVTIDTWADFESYEGFRAAHAEEYRRLDDSFEKLTESEELIGIFEVL